MLDRIKGFVDLDGSGFEIGAKRVEATAAKLGENLSHHLKGAIVGAIGVAAIENMIHRTIELGSRLTDVSRRLGLTVSKFQELSFAFKTAGGSEEAMTSFLERLSTSREKALAGGPNGEKMAQNFQRLGVSQEDLKTNRNDELMLKIGDAIKAGDIQNLIAPLRAVGGKGAGELVAGFKAGLEEKAKEAREAGQVMSDAVAVQLKELEERFKMLGTHIEVEFAPVILKAIHLFEDFTDLAKNFIAFLGGLTSAITPGRIQRELKDPKTLVALGTNLGAPFAILGKLLAEGANAARTAAAESEPSFLSSGGNA